MVKAEREKLMSKEEVGFIVTLTEKFRNEIERKIKQFHQLQGEINQLQINEQLIIELVESMVKATERDEARQKTLAKLKQARETETEKRAETKERLKKEKEEKQ